MGFARDILIARALGAGPVADAFLVAFRLPNMVRRVLGEGGLNAPFVPVYLSLKAGPGGEAEARRFAGEAMGGFAVALLVLLALAELAAPWLVLALAGGFRDVPETLQLAERYTRLALPFLALTVLASLVSAILNAEKRFAVAALAPIVLNIVLIAALFGGERASASPEQAALLLAAAVSAGGAAHLALVIWALKGRAPGLPRPSLGWSAPLRRLTRLGLPALLAGATGQLVLLVATQIASHQPGAVSWLYYADRVFQLPLGFVAVAMGVVLLPEIAAREADGDAEGRQHALDSALALGLLLAIPAAVALAILAEPIVAVLFERGQFGALDRERTAAALAAFALGLPGAVIARVLSQVHFARQKPGVPLWCGLASILVAIVAGLAVAPDRPATGAALSAALAFWTQGALLAVWTWRQRLWRPGRRLMRAVAATLAAAAIMAAAIWWLGVELRGALVGQPAGLRQAALLAGLCGAGLGLYGAAAWAFGALKAGLAATQRGKSEAEA